MRFTVRLLTSAVQAPLLRQTPQDVYFVRLPRSVPRPSEAYPSGDAWRVRGAPRGRSRLSADRIPLPPDRRTSFSNSLHSPHKGQTNAARHLARNSARCENHSGIRGDRRPALRWMERVARMTPGGIGGAEITLSSRLIVGPVTARLGDDHVGVESPASLRTDRCQITPQLTSSSSRRSATARRG
jgi:hypothetical protein